MQELNKTQLILLALLVSFMTSLVTAIVTATLVTQAPLPLTQTINKVVEKTIETIVPTSFEEKKNEEPKTVVVSEQEAIIKLVENYSSAVVNVVASKDLPVIEQYYIDPFGGLIPEEFLPQFQIPQYKQKGTEKTDVSSGTGFFVSPDGLLVTNKHVVADLEAEYSIILNDGRRLPVTVLARDPFQDIAILKVDGSDYKFIPLGNSNNIRVGQTVIAIGNSLGEFQNTVSMGIVSGLNRTIVASGVGVQTEQLQKIIQTDAAINPGNSGGPLLNIDGRVIGINVAVAEGAENVGFALPVNIAKKAIADVQEFGKIRYAFLGIRYIIVNESIKQEKNLSLDYGVILVKGDNDEPVVYADGPADKAGLKEGDIVFEIDGVKIDQQNMLGDLMANKRVGDVVNLKVLRGSETMIISVTLDERPETL